MAVRDIVVRLRADVRAFERDLSRSGELARRQAQAMDRVGKGAVVMGAAMAAGLLVSAKAAIEWESAWAGVTKTVDGTAEQMSILEDELRAMATTLPITAVEIAKVAESAGQLGVAREDITSFTKTMIDLGVSTNLTADEAASSIAKIANVMGTFDEPQGIERFGAALVALGNDGASTEADILAMATRIAGAAQLVGASESDVLALSNALSSMGVQAELGGGVMTRVLLKMYESVNTGGEALQGFADVAGVSASEFATQFSGEPIEALDTFIQGLSRIEGEGGNVVQALKDVGLQGTYNMQVLLQLKGAGDLLTDSLVLGNQAWAANAALVEEANKRYDTTESKLKVAKNNFNELLIALGTHLLPIIGAMAEAVGNLTSFFAQMPGPVQKVLVIVASLGAALGLFGGAALIVIPRLLGLQAALIGVGFSATAAARAMTAAKVAIAATGIGAVVVGIATAVSLLGGSSEDSSEKVSKLATDLQDLANSGAGADKIKALFEALGSGDLKTAGAATKELQAFDDALVQLVQGGNLEGARLGFLEIQKAAAEQGITVEQLAPVFQGYTDALRTSAVEGDTATQATYDLAKGATAVAAGVDSAFVSIGHYAEALGLTEDETKAMVQQMQDWGSAIAGFITPLDAYTEVLGRKEDAERETAEATAAATKSGEDSWEDYVGKVSVSVGEYLGELERQVQAQQNWQRNMLILSSKVSTETLDQLARLGPEGAPLVAQLVNASDRELARLEDAFTARTAASTENAAGQLRLAGPVLAAIAKTNGDATVRSLTAALAAGTTTVAQVAARYGVSLRGGIAVAANQAMTAVDGLVRTLGELRSKTVTLTVNRVNNEHTARRPGNIPVSRAGGGPIYGPGSGTSDSIPAWLSNGEHVLTAAEVRAAGGQDAVERMRRAILSGRMPRFAVGGAVGYASGGTVRPPLGGRTLLQAAQGMDSVEAVRALVASYDRYLDRLDKAADRQRLLGEITEAVAERAAVGTLTRAEQAQKRVDDQRERARRAELVHETRVAKGAERTRALRELAEYDQAQRIEKMRETERLNADKAAADQRVNDAKATYYANERADAADRERQAIEALVDGLEEQARAQADAARAAEEAAAAAEKAAEDRARAQEQALDTLNGLLDQEQDIKDQLVQLTAEHDQRVAELRANAETATREHYASLQTLAAEHAAKVDGLLAQRTTALAAYIRIDEQSQMKWGASAAWLIRNTIAQTRELQAWTAELATARQRGLSEAVIGALGLDDGPAALNQLRQLNRATAEEIAALNQAVVDRTGAAAAQTTAEATGGYGALGAALAQAATEFSTASLALQEQHAAAQAELQEQITTLQGELLAEQTELALKLASIGTTQGRSYAEALAAGMASGVPAIRAAAAALQAAMTGQALPGTTGAMSGSIGGGSAGGALPGPRFTTATPAGLAAAGGGGAGLAYQLGAGGSFSSVPLSVAVTMHSYSVVDGKVISEFVTTDAQNKAVMAQIAGVTS